MDLRDLTKLYTADGPFVSLYLATPRATPNAAQQWDVRWKDLIRQLEQLGVDDRTTTALSDARGEHASGATRVLVASHGAVHLAESLPEAIPADLVRLSPLPHLLPYIDAQNLRLAHLIVLADRQGADILAYTGGAEPAWEQTLVGTTLHTRKVRSGGWNMRHMQAHAEEGWDHNAKDVAAEIDRIARAIDPRVIVVAGDVRAVQLLGANLASTWESRLRQIDGSRAVDGGADHVADRVLEVLADERTRDTMQLLDEWESLRGQAARGVEGLPDTIAALRTGQVDTLILTDRFNPDRALWFGADPLIFGSRADEIDIDSSGTPGEAAAIDVLVRAALATDAAIRLVTGGVQAPREGVGAVLRYAG